MRKISDGRIIIDTQVDSTGAEKGVSSLGGKLSNVAKGGLKIFTGAVAAAGTAITGLGAIGVKFNSDMEQYMASFETMLGGAEAAVKHLDELKKFASKTPFEIGDLAKASQTLLAFGANVEDVTPILKMLGDISLGNKEKFNSLALVFGQVQSQGKLMGQDLMQMINAGFNPLQVISEQTGKSMADLKEEMSDGLITYDMVTEAMQIATSEGGQFAGAMEKQSQTAGGLFSTLKDNFKTLVGDVFIPLSESIKTTILPTTLGYIDTLSKAFKEKGVNGLVAAVGDIFANIIASGAEQLPKIIDLAVQIVQSFVTGIQNNLQIIITAAMSIMMSLFNGFIQLLPQVLELGLQFIIQLGQGIAHAIPGLIPVLINVILGMCDTLTSNIGTIVDVGIQILMALIQGLITSLPTLISEAPRIINEFSAAIYAQLPTILKAGIDILLMLIKGLIDSIPTLIANIPQIILAIVNVISLYNWAQLGKNLITWLGDGLTAMKGNIGNIAKGVAEWAGNCIKNIFSGGLSWGKSLISSIGQGFSSMMSFLGSSASSIATNALNSIKGIFSGGVNIGKDLIKGIWNGISSMGSWIMNLIGGFAGSIVQGIKDFFKIKSPSRLMRDEVGKYLAMGIGDGFEQEGEGKVLDRMKGVASNMVGQMQLAVAHSQSSMIPAAVSGIYNSRASTVNNNQSYDNGITLHIENFNNERETDIETLSEELAFYTKNSRWY
ncbi:tape measure protein [Clostridium culturomicium]|uniref:tape measure protein n=1 Tax=Clostridium culturomicium TaxID=1499683 RepID=UPI003857D16E